MSGSAVSCRRVKKEFGQGENRALVLRGVDLDVRFGEMTLLVGPSGCCKTTLLSVIAGLLDATDGEISQSVKRIVWKRDEGKCQWRTADGEICGMPASLYSLEAGIVVPELRCPTTPATLASISF